MAAQSRQSSGVSNQTKLVPAHRRGTADRTKQAGLWKLRPLTHCVALACLSAAAGFGGNAAFAQTATPVTSDAVDPKAPVTGTGAQTLEGVTVTARRRPEALVDVPLSISVITSKQLEQLDLRNTNDLSYFVPSLEFGDFTYGNLRNDRGSGRALVFRGLAVGSTGAYGGTMFLNGAAVLGNEIPASSMDIGQVEILRGPQSVYFGRSTETGAVSYRTKAIAEQWSGVVETEVAQRNTANLSASISGALIPNLLKTRFTVIDERSDGWVINDYNNGAGRLGDRSRKSISNTLEFTPFDNVSVRTYYNFFKDVDGPSQTSIVPQSYDNCKLPGASFTQICGEIPGKSAAVSYRNTTIPKDSATYLFGQPLFQGSGFNAQTGQQRKVSNADMVADWDINSYLHFQSITGYHLNLTAASDDFLSFNPQTTYTTYFYAFIQKLTDFSQEFRLSSSPDERLSWTLGANYVKTDVYTGAPNAYTLTASPTISRNFGNYNVGQQVDKTIGFFGGAYFKVTPDLTVSAEGRHQSDDRVSLNDVPQTGARTFYYSKDFKSWSPRTSISYDLGHGAKIYTSYATGNRPGGFNGAVLLYQNNPTAIGQINNLLGSGAGSFAYAEEKLRIFELGLKGETADHRGYYDVNGYLGKLVNQQITNSAYIPALLTSVSTTSNAGESNVHGVEAQAGYALTRELVLSGTFAWNYTNRIKYLNTAGIPVDGTTDFSGKKFPNVPEYSGSLVASYTVPLGDKLNILGGNLNFFTTLAGIYRGKEYADYFNAAYIKSREQLDLRAGVSNKNYTLEAFVKNLTNNQGYTGGQLAASYNTAITSNQSFYGGWAPPRQFGVRLRAAF